MRKIHIFSLKNFCLNVCVYQRFELHGLDFSSSTSSSSSDYNLLIPETTNSTTENFNAEVYAEVEEYPASNIYASGKWNEQVCLETQVEDIPVVIQEHSNKEFDTETEDFPGASNNIGNSSEGYSKTAKEEDFPVVKVHQNELSDMAETSRGEKKAWERGRDVCLNPD